MSEGGAPQFFTDDAASQFFNDENMGAGDGHNHGIPTNVGGWSVQPQEVNPGRFGNTSVENSKAVHVGHKIYNTYNVNYTMSPPQEKKNTRELGDSGESDEVIPNEDTLPRKIRERLHFLRSDNKRLRGIKDENARIIERNNQRINELLNPGEKKVAAPKTDETPLDEKLENLRSFIQDNDDVDEYPGRLVLHMIDAKDLIGLQEILADEVKHMFGIHESGSIDHGTTAAGDPETLAKRLSDLRTLITTALDEDDGRVKLVLRLIDAEDISGLKIMLTKEIKRRFGLIDEDASGCTEDTKDMRNVDKLIKRIRSGLVGRMADVVNSSRSRKLVEDDHEERKEDGLGINEFTVQQGRGHLHTIKMNNCAEPLTGVVYLPRLKCICVSHFRSPQVWVYTEDGNVIGSFALPKMKNPSGMVALQTKENAVAISDFHGKRIHLVTLAISEGNVLQQTEHIIWKLPFQAADVASFRDNMLLVASMHDDAISIFNEEGKTIGNVKVLDQEIGKLYSVIGTSKELVLVDCNDDQSAVIWVDLTGKVTHYYSGKKEDEHLMEDPLHVLMDDEGQILVADHDNNRIHQLSKDGKFQQFLLQRSDGMRKPRRFHLDTSAEAPRLFVGCGEVGDVQIRIYDYRSLCSTLLFDIS